MSRYFCYPNRGLPLIKIPEAIDNRPIWIGSPILGLPHIDNEFADIASPLEQHLFLDLNLAVYITQGKSKTNLTHLFHLAKTKGWKPNIFFAALEQHLTHADPSPALEKCANAIKKDYKIDLVGNLNQYSADIAKILDEKRREIELIGDLCTVVKHFYNMKGDLRKKIEKFSELITEKLPVLTTCYLLGCLLFFVKENLDKFQDFSPKVQSDMNWHRNPEKNKTAALNLASDLSYFTTATLAFKNIWPANFHLIRIASSDALMGLILQEMCYGEIEIVNDIPYGTPVYRPGGIAHSNLTSIVKEFMPIFPDPLGIRFTRDDERRKNLANIAEDFLKR